MASIDSVVNLIFNGIDNASDVIGGIGGALGKVNAAVQDSAAPFAELADGLLKAEAAVLAMGAAIGVLAVRETVQFQDSLALVQKQLGDSGVSIEQARKDIEALGLTYGINANEVAKSVAGFLAAGFDYQTAAKLVETSTQLMIAGQLEATFSVEAINKSLAGFRIPAADAADAATKVGDILNKIGDISSGQFEEIVQGFSRISPVAKDAGLSMEETAASIAVLVDIFGSGEIAATALKSGLLSLLNPSKEATETLASLGVASTNSNGELRSSKDLLVDLVGRWGTLTDAQKQQTAAIIFGKEQASAMSALLGDWGKQQDYVAQLVDKTTGAVGSMAREVDAKLKLISSAVATANESWRQFLENLGARITTGDQLQGLINSAGAVGIAFKDVVNQGGFDPLLNLLKSQAGEFSTVFDAIAQNLPEAFKGLDFSGLITSLEGLQGEVGAVFRAFFGEVDLTTVEGLRSALQTLVNTFTALTTTVTGIIETGVKPLAEFLGQLVTKFTDLDKESQLDFGKFLGTMKLIVDGGTLVAGALIGIGQAGRDMGGTMDQAFGVMKIGINSVQLLYDQLAKKFIELSILIDKGNRALAEAFGDTAAVERYTAKIAAQEKTLVELNAAIARNSTELGQGVDQWNKGSEAVERLTAQQNAYNATAGKPIPVTGVDGIISKLAQFEADMERQKAGYDNYFDFLQDIPVDSVERVRSNMEALDDTAQQTKDSLQAAADVAGKSFEDLPAQVSKTEGAFNTATQSADGYARAMEGVSTVYSQVGSGTVKATGAFAAVTDKTQEAKDTLDQLTQSGKLSVDQLLELTQTTNDFKVAMEEIASNERIKNIEFAVNLKTAQLETDMERVKAAFASIDSTIQSTGDLLGSLFGNLVDTDDRWKQLDIQEQIDLENKRRQDALDIQKKLAEAEIERIEAQTASLNRGDALITITGDGLEAELEAFMWKILSKIRVRANAEFADYLLGLGVTP